jgi:hypothetical protein
MFNSKQLFFASSHGNSCCVRCTIPTDWPRVRLSAMLLLPPPAISVQHCPSICDAIQRLILAADSFQQVRIWFSSLIEITDSFPFSFGPTWRN